MVLKSALLKINWENEFGKISASGWYYEDASNKNTSL